MVFPSLETLEQQRADTAGTNNEFPMGPEAFLRHMECVLTTGGQCKGAEACAAVSDVYVYIYI